MRWRSDVTASSHHIVLGTGYLHNSTAPKSRNSHWDPTQGNYQQSFSKTHVTCMHGSTQLCAGILSSDQMHSCINQQENYNGYKYIFTERKKAPSITNVIKFIAQKMMKNGMEIVGL